MKHLTIIEIITKKSLEFYFSSIVVSFTPSILTDFSFLQEKRGVKNE
ncbi:MAG: hypothetical protein ACTSPP_04500 [Candidatus Heimdallarchaeaceae archaeon]